MSKILRRSSKKQRVKIHNLLTYQEKRSFSRSRHSNRFAKKQGRAGLKQWILGQNAIKNLDIMIEQGLIRK